MLRQATKFDFFTRFCSKNQFLSKIQVFTSKCCFQSFQGSSKHLRNQIGRHIWWLETILEKKKFGQKIFWGGLVFKLKFFITMSMNWIDFNKKFYKILSRSLKYCSEVIRSLGKRFFGQKYYVEVISWPCGQNNSTRTKRLCPPTYLHVLEAASLYE